MSDELTGEELSLKLVPAVEEQIASHETPYVKEHYERLLQLEEEDIDETEAKMLIALCLADEVEMMQREDRAFNPFRYQQMLQFLPVLPE